jgi:hypothetical protein
MANFKASRISLAKARRTSLLSLSRIRMGWMDGACGASFAMDYERWGRGSQSNYETGRIMGAQLRADMPDLAPEKLAKVAKSLWPARVAMPRAIEAKWMQARGDMAPMARDPALDEDMVPGNGSGPVPQWW